MNTAALEALLKLFDSRLAALEKRIASLEGPPYVHPVEAKKRLAPFQEKHGDGPHHPAVLAGVIWPDFPFGSQKVATVAAQRTLKKCGYFWASFSGGQSGWMLRPRK